MEPIIQCADLPLQTDHIILQSRELVICIAHLLRGQKHILCQLIYNLTGASQRVSQRILVKIRPLFQFCSPCRALRFFLLSK